jgi:chromosome segregation ATPase
MDFVLDPRVWVPVAVYFIVFVGQWSSQKTHRQADAKDISSLKSDVKDLRKDLGENTKDIALLQEQHKNSSAEISDLVDQFRDLLRDFQRIAVKLAIGDNGKN